MIKALVNTQQYFQAPQNYFWRWAENGEVIEWPNEITICYRDDLIGLLQELSAKGLPPFDALLLVLSACNNKPHVQEKFFLLRVLGSLRDSSTEKILEDAISLMHVIHALPDNLRTGRQRVHLIHEIFKDTGFVFSHVRAREAVDELNSGRIDKLIFESTQEATKEQLTRNLSYLSKALTRYPDSETLAIQLRTGLDTIPPPAEIVLPENSPDLLDQLAQDPKTVGISRLTRRLVAALNIPMHSLGSGDQSYGGITDITNRGNYDKLLLSELAHDTDLLIARLVNNEALYFKREEPPDNPKRQRTILLDTTLKMWGVPRVFAISAALAFAGNVKHGELVEAYALGGKLYKEIRLDTKEGVISSLEILDHALHCGKALQELINEMSLTEYNEFIFITDAAIFNSAAFYASFSEVKEAMGFVLTINREGEIWFYECKKGRTKLLSTAKFDLEELLFAPASFPMKIVKDEGGNRPAFLLQPIAPLLFPKVRVKQDLDRISEAGPSGIIVINETQRVLYISDKDSGAYELLNYIEKGSYTFQWEHHDNLYLVVNNYQRKFFKFYHIDINGMRVTSYNLSDEIQFAKDVVFYHDKMYVRTSYATFLYDCLSKTVTEKKEYAGFREIFEPDNDYGATQINMRKRQNHDYLMRLITARYSIMYKVRKMYITTDGKLGLGNYSLLVLKNYTSDEQADKNSIRLSENARGEEGSHYSKEVTVNRSMLQNKSIKFAVRQWDDGSEAVIDSRGFLHLKSADKSIPEISIVLINTDYTACWASDGMVCGSSYFIDEELVVTVIPVQTFYEKYIQRFIDNIIRF